MLENMSLDEAIALFERKGNANKERNHDRQQIADWLKELKAFRLEAKKKTKEYWQCKFCPYFDGEGYCISNKVGTRPDYLCVNYPVKRG